MNRALRRAGLLIFLVSLAACSSVHTQSRIVISDPAQEGPPVIQIRSQSGQEQVVQMANPASEVEEMPVETGPRTLTHTPELPVYGPVPAPALERGEGAVPAPSRHAYNSVNTRHPVLAITFDDGPHPELTPKLLDLLKARNIRATFYVIGRNVEAYPEIARRIVAEGHEIANHSWSHPALTKLGAAQVAREIQRTTDAIRTATGVTPTTMRPPYGATNASLNRRLNEEFGLRVAMWSVDPQDWKYRNAQRVSNHLSTQAKRGDILLAHDIHASTIAAMPSALDALLAKGFRFVTVSELIELDEAPTSAVALRSEEGATSDEVR